MTPAPTTAPAPGLSSNEDRVIAATLRCIARWGLAKTTLDDIAREAEVSRATVYRAFPGGKDVILGAVRQHEILAFFRQTGAQLDACESLDDLLVTGIIEVHSYLDDHEALTALLLHEPDLVLAHFAMNRLEPVMAIASVFVVPHLARFIGQAAADDHADWVVRNILSYALTPSASVDLDRREDVERLVSTYFLPVLTLP